jgi:hypothetical protein
MKRRIVTPIYGGGMPGKNRKLLRIGHDPAGEYG